MQNAKNINEYQAKLDEGVLPYIKGFALSKEDELRNFIINQLICHFELSFNCVNEKFSINMQNYFATELQELAPTLADGLISMDTQGIRVHNAGRTLIRRICIVFDEYLNNNKQIRYSKII